jgi:hypothetical protein
MGQSILNGPAPDLGTIDLKLVFTEHLAGSKAVGGRRLTAQTGPQQRFDLRRPVRGVITAGATRDPLRLALGACRQVVTVEFVKATTRYFQFLSRGLGVDAAGTKLRKNMANKG